LPCERGGGFAVGGADLGQADEPPQTPPTELFIAGLVVHVQPSRLAAVEAVIAQMPGAEVHGVSLVGKLAVTLEHTDAPQQMALVHAIGRLRGVLSAVIVYQHSEPLIDVEEEISA
jgi:nitrate reductase NapD